ncbi:MULTISPECIES: AMP-binding protein [unclassified Actinopolyspora]|uniref:AMP-binding protein n=1 Tax=unclassified Actinopolyspora TaxID=2639451 RepID=UPI0013F636B9|nr:MULTISPECIES: AMP-binding protein [unclassified Actinopolyspora]NHD16952.1 long-chain fatty acid--CoA ligase [Actinopolyspora sp. BKK2]NHE76104.1 long-chain fatty acid--CoA ligase [Actinopolyspora sp. BKK1]
MSGVYDERPWLARYAEGEPGDITPRYGDMISVLEDTCERFPESVALTYFDTEISYRELDGLADALATYLAERGVGGGDRVALYLQNIPQFGIALLASWKIGAIVVPLNPMYRSHELTTILADAQPAAIVSSEDGWHDVLAAVLAERGVPVVLTTSELDFAGSGTAAPLRNSARRRPEETDDLVETVRAREGSEPQRARLHPDDVALLTYTSGTGGAPKGATNTHRNISFNAQAFTQRADAVGGGIVALAPLFHITGLVCQLGAVLALGGRLDLLYRFEPDTVLEVLRRRRPQYMIGPSTAYVALLDHPSALAEDFASFEQVYSGGAPLPAALVERFRSRFGLYIRNGYGLTETTATATSVPPHLEAPVDEATGTISVGIPTFNCVLRVVDDDGRDLPVGSTGEIVVEGPMVVPAYWNSPERTEEGIPRGRLRTGDVGFMDEGGWFYVVDRKKDMINASGFKVWPREVEDVLYGHPAVREVAVVGAPDAYRGETVKAYVSLVSGGRTTEAELAQHCKQQLAAYKYPREIVLVDELPKTATGKILRRRLREEASDE